MPASSSSFDDSKKSKFRAAIANASSTSVDRISITSISSSRRQAAFSTVEFAVQTATVDDGTSILSSLSVTRVSDALVAQGLESGTLLESSLSLSSPAGTEKIRYLEFYCESTMTCPQYQARSYLYKKSVASVSQVELSKVIVLQAEALPSNLCNLKTRVLTTDVLVSSTKQSISTISLNGELARNGLPNCKVVTQVYEVTSGAVHQEGAVVHSLFLILFFFLLLPQFYTVS